MTRRHIIAYQGPSWFRTLCGLEGIGAPTWKKDAPVCQHCRREKEKQK